MYIYFRALEISPKLVFLITISYLVKRQQNCLVFKTFENTRAFSPYELCILKLIDSLFECFLVILTHVF